jgi:hypothetical protein
VAALIGGLVALVRAEYPPTRPFREIVATWGQEGLTERQQALVSELGTCGVKEFLARRFKNLGAQITQVEGSEMFDPRVDEVDS